MCLGRATYTRMYLVHLVRYAHVFFRNVLLMSTHNFVLVYRDVTNQKYARTKWMKIKMTTIYMLNRGQFDLYIQISIMCSINMYIVYICTWWISRRPEILDKSHIK